MKKLVIALLFLPVFSFAQTTEKSTGKIEIGTSEKKFFIKDGESYRLKEYNQIFSNEEAIKHIQKARTNKGFAKALTYVGSFGIGYGVGMALSKQEDGYGNKVHSNRNTGWTIVGIGAGVTLTSIPLWMGFAKNVDKAIALENGETENVVSQLKLNVNKDGFGLAYQF